MLNVCRLTRSLPPCSGELSEDAMVADQWGDASCVRMLLQNHSYLVRMVGRVLLHMGC